MYARLAPEEERLFLCTKIAHASRDISQQLSVLTWMHETSACLASLRMGTVFQFSGHCLDAFDEMQRLPIIGIYSLDEPS
jgi:hypothetical protein